MLLFLKGLIRKQAKTSNTSKLLEEGKHNSHCNQVLQSSWCTCFRPVCWFCQYHCDVLVSLMTAHLCNQPHRISWTARHHITPPCQTARSQAGLQEYERSGKGAQEGECGRTSG